MFRSAELNEVREKIADLERIAFAEWRESIADIVRRIGDVDAGACKARTGVNPRRGLISSRRPPR